MPWLQQERQAPIDASDHEELERRRQESAVSDVNGAEAKEKAQDKIKEKAKRHLLRDSVMAAVMQL